MINVSLTFLFKWYSVFTFLHFFIKINSSWSIHASSISGVLKITHKLDNSWNIWGFNFSAFNNLGKLYWRKLFHNWANWAKIRNWWIHFLIWGHFLTPYFCLIWPIDGKLAATVRSINVRQLVKNDKWISIAISKTTSWWMDFRLSPIDHSYFNTFDTHSRNQWSFWLNWRVKQIEVGLIRNVWLEYWANIVNAAWVV